VIKLIPLLLLTGCAANAEWHRVHDQQNAQRSAQRQASMDAYCLSNPAECARLDQEQQRINFARRQAFIRALTGSGDQRTYRPVQVRQPTQTNTTCSRWGNTAQCQTYSY
jgi:hypothetical protein